MNFAFYDFDDHPSRGARLVRPFRRLLRRMQRPYFYRLRDLLTWIYHRSEADRSHIHNLDCRLARLEASSVKTDHAMSPLKAKAFTADYLALSRRLASIEDTLARSIASQENDSTPIDNLDQESDLLELSERLTRMEMLVDKLVALYNIDEILPMSTDIQKNRTNAA
ncbi:MAG: hypothetical protein ACRC8S_20830 [Fimbriiglobus sp.]